MKNKNLLSISLVLILSVQFNFAQNSNRSTKIFESYYFGFNYPKKWKQIKSNRDIDGYVVRIAPSTAIFDSEIVMQANDGEFSMNEFNVYIESESFRDLNDFMAERKKLVTVEKQDINIYFETEIAKLSDVHYVEELTITGDNIVKQNHIIRYWFYNEKIYILTFSFEPNKVKKYKKDMNLIINSFRFKN